MIANNMVEIFSIVYSFQLYNLVWDLLTGTGLAYIPFVVAVIGSLMSAKGESKDLIVDLERKVIGMIVVLILAVVPYEAFQTQVNEVSYRVSTGDCYWGNSQGQGDDADLENARDAFGPLTNNGAEGTNYDAKMPLGWFLVSTFSSSITYSTIKGMGCSNSYTKMMSEMSKAQIVDDGETALTERVAAFTDACYKPAMRIQQETGGINRSGLDALNDINWIGSYTFANNGGAYSNEALYLTGDLVDQEGYTYNPDRESDLAEGAPAPYCNEIWAGAAGNEGGLRKDLLDEFRAQHKETEDAFDAYGFRLFVADGEYNDDQLDDLYLKMMLANQGTAMFGSGTVSADGDGGVEDVAVEEADWWAPWTWGSFGDMAKGAGNAIAAAGMTAGAIWNLPDNLNAAAQALLMKEAFIQAVPILMSLAQAVLVIVAPIAMVLGGFRVGTFMILALGYFSLEFTNAIITMGTLFEQRLNLLAGSATGDLDLDAGAVLLVVGMTQIFLLPTIFYMIMANVGGTLMKGLTGTVQQSGGSAAGITSTPGSAIKARWNKAQGAKAAAKK